MRVLIVKTSSLSDVLHCLPALSDAAAALPQVRFDWVVEEAYAEVPGWHPAVDQVIPVALRRWRKQPWRSLHGPEWRQFRAALNKHHYDKVIDAQGLLKSAWLARLVSAPVCGFDKRSVRESLASYAYHHRFPVAPEQHAVTRLRQLFAAALRYSPPTTPADFAIDPRRFCGSGAADDGIVLLHGAPRSDRPWPQAAWRELAEGLAARGQRVTLPWHHQREKDRAEAIAAGLDGVEVLPRLNLRGVANVLLRSRAAVALDTGLGHLAAALGVPCVSLYADADPQRIGLYGPHQHWLQPTLAPAQPHPLSPDQVLAALDQHAWLASAPRVVNAR